MRKMWTKSSKRRSISAATKLGNGDGLQSLSDVASEMEFTSNHVKALIDPDYDTTTTKHAWLNGILQAPPTQDFNESSLRLYRVELRGSHLYVFRPPLLMSVRLFKVDTKPASSTPSSGNDHESTSLIASEQNANNGVKNDLHSIGESTATTSSSTHASGTEIPSFSNNSSVPPVLPKDATPTRQPLAVNTIALTESLTYFLPELPHPALKVNSVSESLNSSSSSLESLVHYFIFANLKAHSESIENLKAAFPLFPNFGEVLKFILAFLQAIHGGKFGDYLLDSDLCDRVISFLKHIEENFRGFLLKSDVAPFIPKILLCLSNVDSEATLNAITKLQQSIVSSQQALLSLIGKVDSLRPLPMAGNVFGELSSSKFMEELELLDLVAAITDIDLLFYQSWNASLDKSLLLQTSISEKNPGDSFYKKNPLIFDNETHIHYLSRLFVHHLFIENVNLAPEKLARLIEKWIDLGCLLDKCGNMSSWLGIASIMLSQPVLRLSNIWSHVGDAYIKLLRNDWSPILFELDRRHLVNTNESFVGSGFTDINSQLDLVHLKESYHILAPRGLGKIYAKENVVPHFGDMLLNNHKCASVTELETTWKKITYSFERFNDYLSNLSNSPEIIAYNQDVLRRYDSMGFLFSNESLNQAFYLGVNKDDGKTAPLLSKVSDPELINMPLGRKGKDEVREKLLRLLDSNCESLSLDAVMGFSLRLQPTLAEGYLKEQNTENTVKTNQRVTDTASSSTVLTQIGLSQFTSPFSKLDSHKDAGLPTFNLLYYQIKLSEYEDLLSEIRDEDLVSNTTHNVVVDDQLVLRIDDFVSDHETAISLSLSADVFNGSKVDDDGSGIVADDFNSLDRLKNFLLQPDSESVERVLSGQNGHASPGRNQSRYDSKALPEYYIPRLASMDRLIDLLLIDSRYFDDSHPIDLKEYRYVFMLNYGSFISTKNLLGKLAHRFVHSGNAVISVMKRQFLRRQGIFDPSTYGSFPRWSTDEDVDLSQLGEVDYELLLQIQANILRVLLVLLDNFYENFVNDLANKNIMIKLLKLYSNEILQWYNSNKIDKKLSADFEVLVALYKKSKKTFLRKSYRPMESLKFDSFLNREFKFSKSIQGVPMNRNLPSHRNVHKVEKFLNKFNKLLAVFYQGITTENWFTVFKVFEDLFVNRSLLNYDCQKASTPESQLKIGDIFSYLSTLREPFSDQKLMNNFPLVFRKLYSLYLKFKAYILIQLLDSGINVDERLERMKTLLVMVQISRLKMKGFHFVFEGDNDQVPSCIETAITSVIYSPESRSLDQLWQRAALGLKPHGSEQDQAVEDLESLLPKYITESDLLGGSEPLLPCFGWIIQNLISLNQCPSFHGSAINFNKRYFLFKLIKEVNVEDFKNEEFHKETKEFEFLLNLNELQVFTNVSNNDLAPSHLFLAVIKRQYSIIISEEAQRGQGSEGTSLTSEITLTAGNTPSASLKRLSLAYKTTSASRFKISGLFNKSRSFGHANSYERVVTYKELPDPSTARDPKQKPVLIIQLKDKKIFPVYLLPYCFKFDTNNASEACFFQASSETDAKDWLRDINFANRHWFFSKSINLKEDHSRTTFGIPLATICDRDEAKVPAVLNAIFEAIEKDGLKEVGIYRISTSLSELNSLKQEINKTGTVNFTARSIDVHTLTSCVKLFFRELPDALITDQVIEKLCPEKRTTSENHDFTSQDIESYKDALSNLPRANYYTLRSLIRHLRSVVEENSTNKMTCSNIATVIGPALTEASNLDSMISNFGVMNHILERLIDNYTSIFDDDMSETSNTR